MSSFKIIYDKLKLDGLNPYPPGSHKGLCDKPYCVILEATVVPSLNSNKLGQAVVEIIVYVPLNSYVKLKEFADSIKASLSSLDFLRKTGFESVVIVDDSKNAYSFSIEYSIFKRLEE